MGPLGFPELMVIFVIAFIVFGPRKLPEIGKTLGQTMNEFKKGAAGFRQTLEEQVLRDDTSGNATVAQSTAPTTSGSEPKSA